MGKYCFIVYNGDDDDDEHINSLTHNHFIIRVINKKTSMQYFTIHLEYCTPGKTSDNILCSISCLLILNTYLNLKVHSLTRQAMHSLVLLFFFLRLDNLAALASSLVSTIASAAGIKSFYNTARLHRQATVVLVRAIEMKSSFCHVH
jgi:hypothetical protein